MTASEARKRAKDLGLQDWERRNYEELARRLRRSHARLGESWWRRALRAMAWWRKPKPEPEPARWGAPLVKDAPVTEAAKRAALIKACNELVAKKRESREAP